MGKAFEEMWSEIKGKIKEISPEELNKRMTNGKETLLLDIREKDEVRREYIPGAELLPRGFLEMQVEELIPDKERPIVVYCAAGVRSGFAAKTLMEMGYKDVASLRGGIEKWKGSGFEVLRDLDFTRDQLKRYSRQIILREVGEQGQAKIRRGRVLIVGAGHLSSAATMYLAAGGVGKLGIVDSHTVTQRDLRGQILHTVPSLGKNRAESAAKMVKGINPDVSIEAHPVSLGVENTVDIIEGYDIILECTGNSHTRYLVNDACVLKERPLFIAEMKGDWGRAMSVYPGEGPCYRCVFPKPDLDENRSEREGGFDHLGGFMGLIQAAEVFKFFLGKGDLLKGELLLLNGFSMRFHRKPVERNRECPLCGEHPTITHLMEDRDSYGHQINQGRIERWALK
ncbi:MAG: ThiF family adenylyltransferase [Syntrophobacterales bacterium]|nr:MAG: ThiF family adenylyltransferase [Syntrophobacterales bacterium]